MRNTLRVEPVDGHVYSTRNCQFTARPIAGFMGWRKVPGHSEPELVICTGLPDDKEVVWMNFITYLKFWRPLRKKLKVDYQEMAPYLVRIIRLTKRRAKHLVVTE